MWNVYPLGECRDIMGVIASCCDRVVLRWRVLFVASISVMIVNHWSDAYHDRLYKCVRYLNTFRNNIDLN